MTKSAGLVSTEDPYTLRCIENAFNSSGPSVATPQTITYNPEILLNRSSTVRFKSFRVGENITLPSRGGVGSPTPSPTPSPSPSLSPSPYQSPTPSPTPTPTPSPTPISGCSSPPPVGNFTCTDFQWVSADAVIITTGTRLILVHAIEFIKILLF